MAPHFDPYANFRFRLIWEGRPVAGVSRVSGLTDPKPAVAVRAGADHVTPRMPGQSEFQEITLERGVTCDDGFEQWASRVWAFADSTDGGQDGSPGDLRKDLRLELYNEAGQKVLSYTLRRCRPSIFVALPELDGVGNAVAIESLVLQNEGWERDTLPGDG